jgi:hypothetical protein
MALNAGAAKSEAIENYETDDNSSVIGFIFCKKPNTLRAKHNMIETLHIKQKVHNVAIAHDIFFAL